MAVDGAHPSPYPGPEPGPPLAAYDAESLARCWRGASAYCLTAAILLLTFAALDRTRFPDAAATLLLVRALGAAALGFLLVLLQTRFGVRHARALGVVAAALMGAIEQLLALGPAGSITEFNREAERVLGWPQAAAVGRDLLTSFVAEGSRATVATDIGKALAGEPTGAFEARMLARDGSERVMACGTRRLVDDDGGAVGVV